MPFPEIAKIQSKCPPQLAGHITSLESIFDELLLGRSPSSSCAAPEGAEAREVEVTPALIAKRLKVDEGLALVLLGEVEKAGLLTHRYDVICPTLDKLLASYETVDELPGEISCPLENETAHSIKEYFVELIFIYSATQGTAE